MTDSPSSAWREPPSATSQENGGQRRMVPVRPSSLTPARPASSTSIKHTTPTSHAKTNPASTSKTANSTPRNRARSTSSRPQTVRLVRSLSYKGPRVKERRWSENDKSPTSTYQDDFRSPRDLSHKLQSLNLETPRRSLSGESGEVNLSTTYRDSFRWRKSARSRESPTTASPISSTSHKGSDQGSGQGSAGPVAGTTRTLNPPNSVDSVDTPTRPKTANDSKGNGMTSPTGGKGFRERNGGSNLFSVLNHEQAASRQSVNGHGGGGVGQARHSGDVSLRRDNGGGATSQSRTSHDHVKQGTNQAAPPPVTSPGVAARQARAAQLQSSVGHSPFAYGSGDETWV